MIDPKTGKTIPGTNPAEGREYLYVAEGQFEDPTAWFENVTTFKTSQRPQSGGILSHNCRLRTPDGRAFLALSYKGDVGGWRSLLMANLQESGLAWATVDGETLRIGHAETLPLTACTVEFYTIKGRSG